MRVAALLCGAALFAHVLAAPPPHLVFILTDDMGKLSAPTQQGSPAARRRGPHSRAPPSRLRERQLSGTDSEHRRFEEGGHHGRYVQRKSSGAATAVVCRSALWRAQTHSASLLPLRTSTASAVPRARHFSQAATRGALHQHCATTMSATTSPQRAPWALTWATACCQSASRRRTTSPTTSAVRPAVGAGRLHVSCNCSPPRSHPTASSRVARGALRASIHANVPRLQPQQWVPQRRRRPLLACGRPRRR